MARILVVDDEEILRMLITDTLSDIADVIDEAENGQEALSKLRANEYDLIILDYMMPVLTGIDVLERLSVEIKNRTPVLMLTAKTQDSDRSEIFAAGAHYFMPKPFSPKELLLLAEDIIR